MGELFDKIRLNIAYTHSTSEPSGSSAQGDCSWEVSIDLGCGSKILLLQCSYVGILIVFLMKTVTLSEGTWYNEFIDNRK